LRTRAWLLAGGLVLAVGCAGNGPPPAEPDPPTEDPAFNALWAAGLEVLRDFNFRPDRTDRREGLMTTFPLTGAYGLECWRPDAVTRRDRLEGSLQTIYRQATVRIRPADEPPATTAPASGPADAPAGPARFAGYRVEVTVTVQRSDGPVPQMTSASEALRSLQAPPGPGAGRAVVVDLGRHPELQNRLAERIVDRAERKLPHFLRLDEAGEEASERP
jgi:hypothetical protein